MARTQQLRLVTDHPADQFGAACDETRMLFEHAVVMWGRNPARCKLGPTRRRAINAMLTIYDAETLMLAIEGVACPLDDCSERMRDAMREIEWLFASESRIERFARIGEALRADVARRMQRRIEAAAESEPVDAAEAAKQRARLAAMAAHMRGQREHG